MAAVADGVSCPVEMPFSKLRWFKKTGHTPQRTSGLKPGVFSSGDFRTSLTPHEFFQLHCLPRFQISIPLVFVELSIKDNGIGIPVEYQDKIFNKFFRVPTGDRHNIKGHGLGLSYIASVIKEHGGTIALQSKLHEGSTFTVRLPQKPLD